LVIVFCKIDKLTLLNNKLGVLIDGDFKFGVLLLVFVRFLGGDTGNLYRNQCPKTTQMQCYSKGIFHLELI
jgi:hypothetical protein